jgi:hypothetical protein
MSLSDLYLLLAIEDEETRESLVVEAKQNNTTIRSVHEKRKAATAKDMNVTPRTPVSYRMELLKDGICSWVYSDDGIKFSRAGQHEPSRGRKSVESTTEDPEILDKVRKAFPGFAYHWSPQYDDADSHSQNGNGEQPTGNTEPSPKDAEEPERPKITEHHWKLYRARKIRERILKVLESMHMDGLDVDVAADFHLLRIMVYEDLGRKEKQLERDERANRA